MGTLLESIWFSFEHRKYKDVPIDQQRRYSPFPSTRSLKLQYKRSSQLFVPETLIPIFPTTSDIFPAGENVAFYRAQTYVQ